MARPFRVRRAGRRDRARRKGAGSVAGRARRDRPFRGHRRPAPPRRILPLLRGSGGRRRPGGGGVRGGVWEHGWVDPVAVLALAGAAADDGWDEGFAGMCAYAAGKGWVEPDGGGLAHTGRGPAPGGTAVRGPPRP